MLPLALIALTGTGYALHAAAHGDWMPLEFTACLFAVYGAAFAGEWVLRRNLSLHRPAELRVERKGRAS